MLAQVLGGRSKEDILKQLIQVKQEIRKDDAKRIIEEQTLADRQSKLFEPVMKQQERTENQVKEISNIVNFKPEFLFRLTNNEQILIAVNKLKLLYVTTTAYLDDRPLKAVKYSGERLKTDIEAAIHRVEGNNRIRKDRQQLHLNDIGKVKLYADDLEQYINWRKNYENFYEKKEEQKQEQGFTKSKCTILVLHNKS